MAKAKNSRAKAKPKNPHSHGAKKHSSNSSVSRKRPSSSSDTTITPASVGAGAESKQPKSLASDASLSTDQHSYSSSSEGAVLQNQPLDGSADAQDSRHRVADSPLANGPSGIELNLTNSAEQAFQPQSIALTSDYEEIKDTTKKPASTPKEEQVHTDSSTSSGAASSAQADQTTVDLQSTTPCTPLPHREKLTSPLRSFRAPEFSTNEPEHFDTGPSQVISGAEQLSLHEPRHSVEPAQGDPSFTGPTMEPISPRTKPIDGQSETTTSSRTLTPQHLAAESYGTVTSPKPTPSQSTSGAAAESENDEPTEQTSLLKKAGNRNIADVERQSGAPSSQAQDYEGLPEVRKRMIYIFPALAIGVFLSAADQTIIASSYGRIGSDLDALNKTSWIATAYFLTLTSFQPLYGKLSDIFSRKSCLLTSYLIFGLGCMFCGLAQDIDQLILARALAGVGGGGMTTVVSIILSDAISLQDRGTWQGFINIIYAAGAGTGAPLGGLLADSIGWRWAFIGQAPLCLAAFIAVGFALHLPAREHEHWLAKLKRIDFVGAFVLVAAVFCLLFGMDRGSNVAWTEKSAYIPAIVSLPLFGLFLLVEAKVAAEPFAPGNIIFSRSLFFAYASNFFAFGGWIAAIFYLPLYYQAVTGVSATNAGLYLVPISLFGVTGSLASGIYMKKTGRYYWLTIIAYATLFVGMTVVTLSSGILLASVPVMIVGGSIASLGNGSGVTTTLIALIANVPREDQAVVTACSYLFRSLGSTTGVSLASTAFNQVLRTQLRARMGGTDGADKIVDEVRRSIDYLRHLPPHVQEVVRQCYSSGTHAAFLVSTVLVFGAALSAWGLREKALSR